MKPAILAVGAALIATSLSRVASADEASPPQPPVAAPVSAAPPATPSPPSPSAPPSPPAPPSPKRVLPDYSGRGPEPVTAGEAALWVPRVVLSPLYFTSEWLVRRPLGASITAAERANLPDVLYDFFAFGPDHKAGVVPIAFVDFGFNPSIGVYGFWDDALFKGDDLRVHVDFWPTDWVGGSVVQRVRFHGKDSVQLKFVGIKRPDHVFYGIGPGSLQSAQSRYGQDKLDLGVLADFPMWRSSRIDAGVGVRSASFYDGHYGRDAGLLENVAAGAFALPDGFTRGYTAEYNDVLVALDSRRPYPAPGSGIRLEAQAEQGSDVRRSPASGWLHYAAGAGGFWDVDGDRRVLSLSVLTMFSDPLGSQPVPFTELVTLGGDIAQPGAFPAPMPGFFPGRMVDRSGAVATLRYKWPIAPFVAGSLQGAVGNVFGEHLEGFDTRLLRFSGAVGIESD
ncbi:MAG TPA: hypothetical protein VIY73_18580, partial [Polyangiaceae bacterium]